MKFRDVVSKRYSCKKYDESRQVEPRPSSASSRPADSPPPPRTCRSSTSTCCRARSRLAIVDELTPCRYGAPTVLAVAFDTSNVYTYPGDARDSGIEDASIVATHMLLAACDARRRQLLAQPLRPRSRKERLGLPENEELLMLLDLGYAAEGAGPLPNHESRKPLSETVTYR